MVSLWRLIIRFLCTQRKLAPLSHKLSFIHAPSSYTSETYLYTNRKCQCNLIFSSVHHRVNKEWQLPISGVHPSWWKNQPWLMRVGCTPTPFHSVYHHVHSCPLNRKKKPLNRKIMYIVAVYTPAERADTLPLFHLPICTLWFPWFPLFLGCRKNPQRFKCL